MSANLAFAEPRMDEAARFIEDDRHMTRYGMMLGPDINLGNFGASRFVGEWPGDIVPARQLLTIPEARSLGPYEVPATVIHGDAVMQQGPSFGAGQEGMIPAAPTSTPDRLRGNTGSRLTRFINPPKVCAFILMRANEYRGMCLFEKIKGAEREEVRRMFSLFMPFNVVKGTWHASEIDALGWDMEREVLGQKVRGPFLDQLRPYLAEGGPAGERLTEQKRVGSGAATAEQLKGAKSMLLEIRAAGERAHLFFSAHLDTSDSEIRRYGDGKPGKQYYDLPDGRFRGGTLPLDVLAMANTRRDPIDKAALREAAKRTDDQNATMLEGFRLIAAEMGAAQKSAVTMEDVQKLIAERDAFWAAKLEALGVKDSPTGGVQ